MNTTFKAVVLSVLVLGNGVAFGYSIVGTLAGKLRAGRDFIAHSSEAQCIASSVNYGLGKIDSVGRAIKAYENNNPIKFWIGYIGIFAAIGCIIGYAEKVARNARQAAYLAQCKKEAEAYEAQELLKKTVQNAVENALDNKVQELVVYSTGTI